MLKNIETLQSKLGLRSSRLLEMSPLNRQRTISYWRSVVINLPDNLPDKASPGETGSASRVTQTEIVYKVTHLYNVFPIAA